MIIVIVIVISGRKSSRRSWSGGKSSDSRTVAIITTDSPTVSLQETIDRPRDLRDQIWPGIFSSTHSHTEITRITDQRESDGEGESDSSEGENQRKEDDQKLLGRRER
jgi:hypothetical protein